MTTYDPAETTWAELAAQQQLTDSLGQVTCGSTTHRDQSCGWCGAAV
jgi:hypothetical protein